MTRTILTIGTLYLVLGVFEYLFPAERGQSAKGRLRNIVFTFIFLLAGGLALGWLFSLVSLPFTSWPEQTPTFTAFIVLAYLFLSDFIFYWYHRAQHRFPWFWVLHELHHADTELNATSSMRTYWLERPIQTLVIVAPVQYFLGLDPTALFITPFVTIGWLFFTHANWKLNLGSLTPIITGPQLHRIHHSRLPEHQGKNFAQFYPVFDVMFGTYYRPKKDEYPPTGTQELASDAPVLETLIRPFKLWFGMLKSCLRRF